MHAQLSADEGEASYAADLFGFEVLRAASRGDGTPRSLTSRYALLAIAEEVQRGLLPIDPEVQPTEFRFERSQLRWRVA